MSGYFGIGIERVSKVRNMGNLIRSAHAFGASFTFTIGSDVSRTEVFADTSKAVRQVPFYSWQTLEEMKLPMHCKLVGIELIDGAIDLPSFMHPPQAAYILGQERGSVSSEIIEQCDYVIKIPSAFCINVATAGAIVMYDRVRSRGRFAPRPVKMGGPAEPLAPHKHGGRFSRRKLSPDATN